MLSFGSQIKNGLEMNELIDKSYCIKHPVKIIRTFGLSTYIAMFFTNKGLLQYLTDDYLSHGTAMPGSLGNAYKLSALFEYRVARIYQRMAEKFKDKSEVYQLYTDLQNEELEHGRYMMVCLFNVIATPSITFEPNISDPEIKNGLNELRKLEKQVESLSLEEALKITVELEQGEVNIIFGKLLKQVDSSVVDFFNEQFKTIEGHSESVPRRIIELKQQLGLETA